MEPRLRRRFHIWHILTSDIAFLRPKCASKDGTFERENCAPKRPARFPASISHPRYLRQLETITRPFLTAARLYIPAVPGWSRIGRYYGQNEQYAQDFQNRFSKNRTKNEKSNICTTKNPGLERPGLQTTWLYATDNESMPQKAEREMRV